MLYEFIIILISVYEKVKGIDFGNVLSDGSGRLSD